WSTADPNIKCAKPAPVVTTTTSVDPEVTTEDTPVNSSSIVASPPSLPSFPAFPHDEGPLFPSGQVAPQPEGQAADAATTAATTAQMEKKEDEWAWTRSKWAWMIIRACLVIILVLIGVIICLVCRNRSKTPNKKASAAPNKADSKKKGKNNESSAQPSTSESKADVAKPASAVPATSSAAPSSDPQTATVKPGTTILQQTEFGLDGLKTEVL
ncbi:hypothetical protein PFISCL1PPCAC_880, partial [Pristionchus fissidentatus]